MGSYEPTGSGNQPSGRRRGLANHPVFLVLTALAAIVTVASAFYALPIFPLDKQGSSPGPSPTGPPQH
jgi:hypothetical protein